MLNTFFLKFLTFFISLVDYSNKKKIILFFKNEIKKKELNIIDIGAHKGETIDLFLGNFNVDKIYSFEPNIALYSDLKIKKKYDNRIELFNFGVGFKEKNEYLNIMTESSSSTFNTLNHETNYYKKKKKIVSFFSKKKNLIATKQKIKKINLSILIK
jgi:FkbM family methyltransferase